MSNERRRTLEELITRYQLEPELRDIYVEGKTDARYQIHGHDFIELLCWYVKPYLRKEIKTSYNSEILAGSLLGCVDVNYLVQEILFQRLLARMSNSIN